MLYNTYKGYLERQYMDYDSTPVSRYSTTIRFVAIGVVLVILFIVGLILSKNMVTSMTDQSPDKVASNDNGKSDEAKQAEKEKQIASEKAASEKAQTDKAEKQAEEAAKKQEAEVKKAQEAAAAAQATAQAAVSTPQTGVASTGPSAVASTGPEEAIPYAIAIGALGYSFTVYLRSRRENI